jgi:hypothetical protein
MVNQQAIEDVLERLGSEDVDEELLAQGLRLALSAVHEGLGECRLGEPVAAIRPIFDSPGQLKWSCTHKGEPHSVTV